MPYNVSINHVFYSIYKSIYWHAHSKYAVVLYITVLGKYYCLYLHTHPMSRGNHLHVTCRSICDVLIGKKFDRSLDCSFLRLLIIWYLRVKCQIAASRSWFLILILAANRTYKWLPLKCIPHNRSHGLSGCTLFFVARTMASETRYRANGSTK